MEQYEERTLTRLMGAALEGFREEFAKFYCKADLKQYLARLSRGGGAKASTLRDLRDALKSCGLPFQPEREDVEYYRDVVEQADLPENMEDAILYALYTHYEEYSSPEHYMKRLVDTLSDPEGGCEGETTRLRILKRFIQYGGYLPKWGYSGKGPIRKYVADKLGKEQSKLTDKDVLNGLDDAIFETEAGESGLLKAADDLAGGKFRAGGYTKKLLYLFAMVYNMTVSTGSGGVDRRRDVVLNLFQDYYSNNLSRFLSPDYQNKAKKSGFELEPSEQGINYKNYAEMVCLYYIAQDLPPLDKVKGAQDMIERIRVRQAGKGRPAAADQAAEGGTGYYRKLFIEDVLELPREAFEAFLIRHYNCDTGKTVGPFELETASNTAYQEYQVVLDELREELGSLEECNYGLWFMEMDGAIKKDSGVQTFPDRREGIDRGKYHRLLQLLKEAHRLLGGRVSKDGAVRRLEVDSAEKITRTDMLVACYYLYNALNDQRWDFQSVFSDFKEFFDQRLPEGYQGLNGKNLLDVIVVVSAYNRQLS